MVDKETKFLREWAVRYIKNKDLVFRKITSVKEEEEDFTVFRGEKEHKFFIIPMIKEVSKIVEKIKIQNTQKSLVCFHTKDNFSSMIDNWKSFVELGREFTIYFANPFSKTDRVLILCPYTHQLITDDSSLKMGLKTMSDTVELTTEEEINKIINS